MVTGLAIEPAQERLWRLRILAAHESRDPAAEQEAIDRMLAIIDDLGGDLAPKTLELLQTVRRSGVASLWGTYGLPGLASVVT